MPAGLQRINWHRTRCWSEIHSLEREKAQLETMLKKENQTRVELKEWLLKTQEKIPKLSEELTKKIEDMVGGGVQLQIDDQRLA